MRRSIATALVAATALCLTACTGVPVKMSDGPRADEIVVGDVSGSSTGVMLFQFIPIGQNPRFQVAHDRAMAQAPGATRLANAEISENWFWAYILNGYKTTVKGTAVRAK